MAQMTNVVEPQVCIDSIKAYFLMFQCENVYRIENHTLPDFLAKKKYVDHE